MNVCLVTPAYPPCYGGVATSVEMRLRGLRACGLSGLVLTLEYDGVSGSENVAGFEVRRFARLHGRNQWGPLDAVQAFQAVLRYGRKADVVHIVSPTGFFSIGASLAAIILKKKWILEMSLLGADDPISACRRRIGWLYRLIFHRAHAVVGVSSALVSQAREFGLQESRLFRIPYPVDSDLFRPVDNTVERVKSRNELKLPQERVILCYVGFFSQRKGTHLIIDALERLPSGANLPYVALIGWASESNQEYGDRLQAAVERANLVNDVRFVGRIIDRNLLARYLRASDLFILPSAREGFPVATLEAMASGLCAILTDIPGITDDIAREGDNAIIVNRSADDLAEAIQRCASNSGLREKISISARQTILEGYTLERVGTQYADLYSRIIPSKMSSFLP